MRSTNNGAPIKTIPQKLQHVYSGNSPKTKENSGRNCGNHSENQRTTKNGNGTFRFAERKRQTTIEREVIYMKNTERFIENRAVPKLIEAVEEINKNKNENNA